MIRRASVGLSMVILVSIAMYWLFSFPSVSSLPFEREAMNVERGAYLVNAGGCVSCHEGQGKDGLSGGLALESEFGTFYAPNITPDLETGIGNWKGRDFLFALKHGRGPQGQYYFPAFPYRAYASMADQDVLDIAAYLLAQDPIVNEVPSHETPIWLRRWMLAVWNLMADIEGGVLPVSSNDPSVLRGAYLARSLGHCSECHTPRNRFGILLSDQEFKGATMGQSHAEAIDSAALADWSEDDLAFFLFLGMKPDGEYIGGEMEAVIEHNTSMLTEEDRQALASFFKR